MKLLGKDKIIFSSKTKTGATSRDFGRTELSGELKTPNLCRCLGGVRMQTSIKPVLSQGAPAPSLAYHHKAYAKLYAQITQRMFFFCNVGVS